MALTISLDINEDDKADAVQALAEKYGADPVDELGQPVLPVPTDGQKAKAVLVRYINRLTYSYRRGLAAGVVEMKDVTDGSS